MFKSQMEKLVDAALDQPNPTPALSAALNDVLTAMKHPMRDRARDPRAGTVGEPKVDVAAKSKTVFPG